MGQIKNIKLHIVTDIKHQSKQYVYKTCRRSGRREIPDVPGSPCWCRHQLRRQQWSKEPLRHCCQWYQGSSQSTPISNCRGHVCGLREEGKASCSDPTEEAIPQEERSVLVL